MLHLRRTYCHLAPDLVPGVYPKELILDNESINKKHNEVKVKIVISQIDTNIFEHWMRDINKGFSSVSKSSRISNTGMWMVKKN